MTLTKVVRLLRGGRITIPAEFRAKLGMDDRAPLRMTLVGKEIRVRSIQVSEAAHCSAWVRELYDLFASVRKEAARHSEKEIDAGIERAVTSVRRKRRSRHA